VPPPGVGAPVGLPGGERAAGMAPSLVSLSRSGWQLARGWGRAVVVSVVGGSGQAEDRMTCWHLMRSEDRPQ
jgi:hypothetical protein